MRFALALVALLAACDTTTDLGSPAKPLGKGWQSLPVELRISDQLNLCQRAALYAAQAYVEAVAGRELFVAYVVGAESLSVSGLPPYGVVGVSAGALSRPGVLDEATLHRTQTGALHSVDVRVGACSPRAYAHELVHALGLGHGGRGRLMALEHDGDAWRLDPEELGPLL